MRNIKFRAWDIESKQFVKQSHRETYIDYKSGDLVTPCIYELMLYTGVKDKNDKEIYEGDILTSEQYPFQDEGNFNYNAEVSWSDSDACFFIVLHCVNSNKRGISDGICELLSERNICFEVIGNIYENPELIEKEKPKRATPKKG